MALYLGSSEKKKLRSGLYRLIYKIVENLQFAKVGDVIDSDIVLIASWTRVEQEPIAYLYNGVQLPPLPEWDTVAYPYAVIYWDDSVKRHYLFAVETENYYSESYGTMFGTNFTTKVPKSVVYLTTGEEWELQGDEDYSIPVDKDGPYTLSCPVIWTNFDLNYSDGTLYCGASEPIPVYE